MASRLGLLPWERDRLSPAELKDLWDGWTWRYSRGIEALSMATLWLRSMMDSETDFEGIINSMPGYDGELERQMRLKYGAPPDLK